MLSPKKIFQDISNYGISFYTGVPDSLLKDFCAYITDNTTSDRHIIAVNEGNAISLACGYFLGTGQPALVYMQNSGIGNAINPILSLADKEVYGIPMLILIGWRGEEEAKDEPQHVKQGRVITQLLEAMEIPWFELSPHTINASSVIRKAVRRTNSDSSPVVIMVRKGTFEKYASKGLESDLGNDELLMSREDAILRIVNQLDCDDLVVSTTGMASRELFEIRVSNGQKNDCDFLTVGGMGHASSIAMGLAISQKRRLIVCIDGDGAALMHLGALALIGQSNLSNLIHIVINNGAHDSVGGQPTVGHKVKLTEIALACGYKTVYKISKQKELSEVLALVKTKKENKLIFIDVHVKKGVRLNLGRPTKDPKENKKALMVNLGTRNE